MALGDVARIRQTLFQIHRWTALVLFIPLVLLGLTGSVLMWPDAVERLTNPVPAATEAAGSTAAPDAYVAAARAVLPPNARITGLKMPTRPTAPVEVTAATGRLGPGGGRSVWLEPATAKVIKSGPTRAPLYAFAHDFHGAFMIDGGRPLVGLAGLAMLFLSLSGVWLWWPRGAFAKAFRWRRTPSTLNNLHHMVGFWISLPLALISLTGVFISFPSLTNAVFGAASQPPAAARPPGPPGGPKAPPQRSPDQVVGLAQAQRPGARLVGLTYPGSGGGRGPAALPPTAWRVELEGGGPMLVDDVTGAVSAAPKPRPRPAPSGARGLIRPLHEGEVGGALWRWLVFAAGVLPAVLAFSGVFLWARNQARKAKARA